MYIVEEIIIVKKITNNKKPSHICDPKNIHALESQERKIQQDPKKIIEILALKQSDIVADMGCGSGFFTVPIAKKVDKVYAIDVQQEMLDFLEQKIKKNGNIEPLLSKAPNQIPLQNESITILLTVNTLHEFQYKEQMINEIYRVLKHQGKLQ